MSDLGVERYDFRLQNRRKALIGFLKGCIPGESHTGSADQPSRPRPPWPRAQRIQQTPGPSRRFLLRHRLGGDPQQLGEQMVVIGYVLLGRDGALLRFADYRGIRRSRYERRHGWCALLL